MGEEVGSARISVGRTGPPKRGNSTNASHSEVLAYYSAQLTDLGITPSRWMDYRVGHLRDPARPTADPHQPGVRPAEAIYLSAGFGWLNQDHLEPHLFRVCADSWAQVLRFAGRG